MNIADPLAEQSFIEDASIPGKHTLVLYEDAGATEQILFRSVGAALRAGRHVVYTTHSDDAIEIRKRMADFGVPVEEKGDLLHIYKIANPMQHPKGAIEGTRELQRMLFSQAKPPFLIVSTLIPEIKSGEHADCCSMIEEDCHRNFGNECALICSYDMNKATHASHNHWLVNMLKSHHDVLFVPRMKVPLGIRMR